MLTLKCQGQQTTIAINEKIATDFISVNIVKFEFCERWKDMEKVAQFTQFVDGESKTYSVYIDELTNTAVMPNEVQAGELQISAFGTHPVSGVRITTIPAKITVEKSGYVGDGETPIPPTPDLYTQFIAKLSTLAKVPSVPGGSYRYELATDGSGGMVWERRYLLPGERVYSLRGAATKKEDDTYKIGYAAVALGSETEASGDTAFAAGRGAKATGDCGVALGQHSKAIGNHSFATGVYAESNGTGSFAAGDHAEANGNNSVAVGLRCRADGESQFVFGKNNAWDKDGRYAHIVGNGKDSNNRSNAHTLDWDGNTWFAGDVYVGGANQDEGERLARMSDLRNASAGGLIFINMMEVEEANDVVALHAYADEDLSVLLTYAEGKALLDGGARLKGVVDGAPIVMVPLAYTDHNDGKVSSVFSVNTTLLLVYSDSILD